ncbi:hypothetical protein K7432_012522 [Basidiobolus ranarum]|uniref:Uncharacterized protein n=1 Tax=Basidiobolus ranarum TaxID=34480 RepID=A0ABR2VSA4_9FUNG
MVLEVTTADTNPLAKGQLFLDLKDLPRFEVPDPLVSPDTNDTVAPLNASIQSSRPLIRSPLIRARSFQASNSIPKNMVAMTPPLPRFSHSLLSRTPRNEDIPDTSCGLSRQERTCARKALVNPVSFEDMHKIIEIEYMFVNGRSLSHPGRVFVKEGILMKDTGNAASPRQFFLFTDVLVYGTPLESSKTGCPLENQTIINLAYTKVEHVSPAKWILRLYTKKEAFSIIASSEMEYTSWFHALQNSIACHKTMIENEAKKRRMAAIKNGKRRSSFSLDMNIWRTIKNVGTYRDESGDRSSDSSRTWSKGERKCSISSASSVSTLVDGDCSVPWVPDQEALSCMSCKITKFSMMVRRHHCRLCGRVICWKCSHLREHVGPCRRLVRICKDCLTWKAVGAVISQGELTESQHLSPLITSSVIRGCQSDASSSTMGISYCSSVNSTASESFIDSTDEYSQEE